MVSEAVSRASIRSAAVDREGEEDARREEEEDLFRRCSRKTTSGGCPEEEEGEEDLPFLLRSNPTRDTHEEEVEEEDRRRARRTRDRADPSTGSPAPTAPGSPSPAVRAGAPCPSDWDGAVPSTTRGGCRSRGFPRGCPRCFDSGTIPNCGDRDDDGTADDRPRCGCGTRATGPSARRSLLRPAAPCLPGGSARDSRRSRWSRTSPRRAGAGTAAAWACARPRGGSQ
mmetsp:Transcript_23287/g.49172  ORF Transcript_23287/g.49172 Transcript_23287/m.49172 type:complete len:227 (-) Transcript_23287:391-1071(-)